MILKQTSYRLIDFTWRKPLNQPLRAYKSFHFVYVSVIEVAQLLQKLKRKKAAGNDDLPPGLLKDSAAVISAPHCVKSVQIQSIFWSVFSCIRTEYGDLRSKYPYSVRIQENTDQKKTPYLNSVFDAVPFTHIINLSLQPGAFPSDWKIAKILPLYKNGATDQFGNYRPISILPVISKVDEKIVHIDYISESKLLSTRQFRFCARRSTELAVTLLFDNLRKNADSKLLTGCVFTDFSKAFDTISHAKLPQKSEIKCIQDTKCRVRVVFGILI